MNITLGVPRVLEIINAVANINTPIITASLINNTVEPSARIVKGRIEITKLGEISKYIEEVFTPNGCFLNVKIDLDTINALYLELTIEDIWTAIIKHPAIKLDKNSVTIYQADEIHVSPSKKGEVYF